MKETNESLQTLMQPKKANFGKNNTFKLVPGDIYKMPAKVAHVPNYERNYQPDPNKITELEDIKYRMG
jgi:hypothetical protein